MNKPFCKMTIKDLLDELHERETGEGGVGVGKGWEAWPVVRDINELFESPLHEGACHEDGECSTLVFQALPFVKQVNTLM